MQAGEGADFALNIRLDVSDISTDDSDGLQEVVEAIGEQIDGLHHLCEDPDCQLSYTVRLRDIDVVVVSLRPVRD